MPGRRSSSRTPHWPPIPGRSAEHDGPTPTGTPPEEQARVTAAQRELERQIVDDPLIPHSR
ncbi:MAG: hypothetical protein L0Y64_18875 [Myxococcaceae bacterium]|nr:hypothetical protein [Myxococcaceae bacterium]